MTKDGVSPSKATAHAVLGACAKAGAGRQARALLAKFFTDRGWFTTRAWHYAHRVFDQ